MPSAMTTEEALTILREAVELLYGCPDEDVAELHAELADKALEHLASLAADAERWRYVADEHSLVWADEIDAAIDAARGEG